MKIWQKVCAGALVVVIAVIIVLAVVSGTKAPDNPVLPTPVAVVETTDTATLGE